jgi:hypothetical protein
MTAESRQAQYLRRYVPGQQLYFHAAQPQKFANILLDNNDYEDPKILRK